MVRSVVLAVLFAVVAPTLAHADKKVLPGSQHEPPVFLDETVTFINLGTARDGYSIRMRLRISGATSATDRMRVEWKQGGKLLATLKCDPGFDADKKTLGGICVYDKLATALGPIDADVIYSDDQTEKDYLVRTLHVSAKKWNELGKDKLWQIMPDDLIAGAWARIHHRDGAHPQFVFWIERKSSSINASMRCTVDGKKIDDIDANLDNVDLDSSQDIEADHVMPNGRQTYHWTHVALEPWQWSVGPRAKGDNVGDVSKSTSMIDHPGKWECKVRNKADGLTFRELTFTVDKTTGQIVGDEMNTGKGAIPTMPDVVMVDMRIPKDSKFDERIRPEAMKKSFGFGIPWPDNAKVKQVHASFPAASGLPD